MTTSEVQTLLGRAKTVTLTTLGADGYPHPTAMWFLPGEDAVRMWTYGKSQKAVNLRRDPRAALLVEEGEVYSELRGVLIRSDVEIVSGFEVVRDIGKGLYERYTYPTTGIRYEDGPRIEIERQARKRVGLIVPLDRVASWDHSKL